jgi:hypothetical protein
MGKPSRLSEEQHRALAALKRIPATSGLYLAGGAGVAWHLGHRVSNDLDLFSTAPTLAFAPLRRAILAKVRGAEVSR